MSKFIKIFMAVGFFMLILTGCRESERVSYNVSKEADSFNVVRRVAIINTRTDKVEFEVIGRISVDVSDDNLTILVETQKEEYKKHFVNLTEWNMYIVEDLEGAQVDKYRYEVNYLPEMIVPFKLTSSD